MTTSGSDKTAPDRRFRVGLVLGAASLLIMGIGLFAVVSALTDSGVKLPHQGSIEDIVGGGAAGATIVPGHVNDNTPAPTGPKPVRIAIPRIYVDAPIVELGFEPGTAQPAVPDRGDEAAWYDFNPPPGIGFNALFSGHVDWQTPDHKPVAGVFYRLRELEIGDLITVTLEDGRTLDYRVTGNVAAQYTDPNVVKAMQPVEKDVITLMTCGGEWIPNPSEENGGNYSDRIVVRAERVADGAG